MTTLNGRIDLFNPDRKPLDLVIEPQDGMGDRYVYPIMCDQGAPTIIAVTTGADLTARVNGWQSTLMTWRLEWTLEGYPYLITYGMVPLSAHDALRHRAVLAVSADTIPDEVRKPIGRDRTADIRQWARDRWADDIPGSGPLPTWVLVAYYL